MYTNQPVNAVRIDLSKDKWDIIFEISFSIQDGFDWGWTAAVYTCICRAAHSDKVFKRNT